MVKNEQKTICRLLESCKGIATHYVIVDTGSTDNTKQVSLDWLKSNNCVFSIHDVPFKDFGTTRTKTLLSGQQFVKNNSLDSANSYLLLLDADMILINKDFKSEDLKCDVIRLIQYDSVLSYKNVRLVRSNLKLQYIGRTHEYVDISGNHTSCDYYNLCIRDVGDGGCKSDKFQRDLKLLKEDLIENPANGRSLYYLASTYESLGENKKSIQKYSQRIYAGGWDEEVWMAQYRRGIVYLNNKDISLAENDFIKCWTSRPWRSEPLFRLAQLYLDTNRQKQACAIAKAALNIKYPTSDSLFIESKCYYDEFHKILSIGDFYAGKQYDGLDHAEILILKDSPYRDNALQNASWYMEKLPVKKSIDLGSMISTPIDGWSFCNPSIINSTLDDGYNVSVRSVNYKIREDGSYDYPGFVATQTFVLKLNKNLEKISDILLSNPPSRDNSRIRGIEDIRLFSVDHQYINALGTRLDDKEDYPQIFKNKWKIGGSLVESTRISPQGTTEKNWLPFTIDDKVNCLYTTGPKLTTVDLNGNIVSESVPSIYCSDFRGGAAPIQFKNGWLWVIHQVTVRSSQTRRIYLHRFVWVPNFNEAQNMIVSKPFCFQEHSIEFCSGMCHGKNGEILMTYGFLDNKANLLVVDSKTITDMLKLG
jgi:tetratricopeptide (TPR) repeat protein